MGATSALYSGTRFVLLVVFVLLLSASATAADRVCGTCGQEVTGEYFETNGVYFHPDHFRCTQCNLRIDGPYTEYKDKNYHTDCFRDHVALRCDLCGEVIQGEYILDYWGNAYHKRHQGSEPQCDSCSRFISEAITGGGAHYDDGRYICAICRKSSVTDRAEILALIDEVAEHMGRVGMKVDRRGMRVHLIGRQQLNDVSRDNSNALRGFTDYSEDWRILGRAGNRRIDTYFLYAMPRIELISTIAHELAHIWQFNQGRFNNDRAWSEGSCNYAAYLVLGRYPGRESSFFRTSLTQDPDPVYGDGFRRVKRYVEERGDREWLRRLRRESTVPAGY